MGRESDILSGVDPEEFPHIARVDLESIFTKTRVVLSSILQCTGTINKKFNP